MAILSRTSGPGVVASLLLISSSAGATTYRVPGDVPTIQAGINVAQPGDSVLVAAGIYSENLNMQGGIVLVSENGSGATIVDGRFLAPVVNCYSINDFTIEGFTLRRGFNADYPGGAGMAMDLSGGTILSCEFLDNRGGRDGGGISVVSSQATIRGCTFRDNSAYVAGFLDGGGVFCYLSNMVLEDCLILDNIAHEGGGIAVSNHSTVLIRRCIIRDNEATGGGGGIVASQSFGAIENNTLLHNITPFSEPSLLVSVGNMVVQRNIIAEATGVGLYCQSVDGSALCNDVWNSLNTNFVGCAFDPTNFSADPQFCNRPAFDLRLSESSPCAPAHSPAGCNLIGALDIGCGPVTVESATWGRIKTHYRETAKTVGSKDSSH